MKVFKYIEDGRIYCLVELNGSQTAIPVNHDGKPINNCDVSKFILVTHNTLNREK
jgi:hypothetical protein